MMGRTCVLVILAVCILWTFGETLSCDQCGRECMPSCGTRQFRACCFNNLKKRTPDLGFKLWVAPPSESVCVLWSSGEILSCDSCGHQCMSMCGTRKFRACCYNNNQLKRTSDPGFEIWLAPPPKSDKIGSIYDP